MLFQHVGMIIVGFTTRMNGKMCKRCIDRLFRRYTLITLAFGWWGLHSVVLTPILLLLSVYAWVRSRSLEAPAPGATAPELDELAVRRLERYQSEIASRLELKEDREAIARDIATRSGSTPGQALLFSLVVAPPAKPRSTVSKLLRRAA